MVKRIEMEVKNEIEKKRLVQNVQSQFNIGAILCRRITSRVLISRHTLLTENLLSFLNVSCKNQPHKKRQISNYCFNYIVKQVGLQTHGRGQYHRYQIV